MWAPRLAQYAIGRRKGVGLPDRRDYLSLKTATAISVVGWPCFFLIYFFFLIFVCASFTVVKSASIDSQSAANTFQLWGAGEGVGRGDESSTRVKEREREKAGRKRTVATI